MNNDFNDDMIRLIGWEGCLEMELKHGPEMHNFKQVGKRVRELNLDDKIANGMDIKDAIKNKLISKTDGYRKYPQPKGKKKGKKKE